VTTGGFGGTKKFFFSFFFFFGSTIQVPHFERPVEQSIQECRVLSEQAATAYPSGPEVFTGMVVE
jgi:hypothetical protein